MRDAKGVLSAAILAAIIVVALIRVAATHKIFSAVVDEPVHIAAGYDWVVLHSNGLDPVHPPLARIISAIPLAAIPPPETNDLVWRGNLLLYHADHYERNLARARRGNLIFLAAALICAYVWGRWSESRGVGWIAAALLGTLPPVLGHAGLATTDMAVAATLPLSLIAFEAWVARPTVLRTLLASVAIAAGVLSKFSFLTFFPAAALIIAVARRRDLRPAGSRLWLHATAAVFVVFMIVWAVYFFDLRTVTEAHPDSAIFARGTAMRWIFNRIPLPAPLFVAGLHTLYMHNKLGQLSYMFGYYSNSGWWYYFPVLFFFKTPLPFTLLTGWGIAAAWRRRNPRVLQYALIAAVIMLVSMTSHLNIGIRHILPLYPPLAVVAAYAVKSGWSAARSRVIVAALLLWLLVGTALAHPDYMAWFNEAAGRHPERIATDSNLDWGQDLLRLGREARRRHIERMYVLCIGSADLQRAGVPLTDPLPPFKPVRGWVAVSETAMALEDEARAGGYRWLDAYIPVTRVGRSIRLYDTR